MTVPPPTTIDESAPPVRKMYRTPVATLVRWLGKTGRLPRESANKVARAMSHCEHAAGAVVWIEFAFPHVFGPIAFVVFSGVFLAIRFMTDEPA